MRIDGTVAASRQANFRRAAFAAPLGLVGATTALAQPPVPHPFSDLSREELGQRRDHVGGTASAGAFHSGVVGAIWGTNAVDGVINIVTQSAADTQGVLAEAGAGSVLLAVRWLLP